ncbi:unnamed protein product [Urochloa decumbens]|uniref:Mediator complex subunit 15 KIX domain-containing protein n=1 Tax=Urochloa decumbens TaxID=240449 RepID=A0ABC9BF45_9POAL
MSLESQTNTQHNPQVIPIQKPPGPASVDSTAQTAHPGAGDFQEELYQTVKSLKDQYFAELSDLYNKITMKIQHVDNYMPAQKSSDQYEKMKNFKALLERTMHFLQVNKSSIQPGLRGKIPIYERQIGSILNSQRSKPVQAPGQQLFQQSGGQAPSSNISQQHQASQGLQQHDSHANQIAVKALKLLSMESQTNTQHNPQVIPIQKPPGPPASVDLTCQTGHPGAGDFQEELYQTIKSLKDQYFAELSDLYSKISMKIQHVDIHMPAQKSSDQYEKMKNFKAMLERTLHFFQVNKSSIQQGLREKIPIYERQIVIILNSQRSKPVQAPGQQLFQQSGGQAPSSNISQQHQASQGLQQHDSHANQITVQALKLLSMESQTNTQHNSQVIPIQKPPGPAKGRMERS